VAALTSPPIEAQDLYRFFHAGENEALALRGVSLQVQPGEMVAVTGPSGSGKSTLLACIAGLDDPDGGTVKINGEVMSRRTEPIKAHIRSRHLGLLLQTHNLVDHLTVANNILLAQRLAGKVDRARAAELCELVGISHRAHALPSELSRGEGARAGLAVALANRPTVLLADEPTGELDGDNELRIVELLHDVTEDGGAVLVVTHNAVVSAAAHRIVELTDGMVSS
jgi:putative ABC transport system ATP-binding protein